MIKELSLKGKTIITITHDMEFVSQNFKRTVAIADGMIIAEDSTERIFSIDDIMSKAHLEPPCMSRLSRKLSLGDDILTIENLINKIKQIG